MQGKLGFIDPTELKYTHVYAGPVLKSRTRRISILWGLSPSSVKYSSPLLRRVALLIKWGSGVWLSSWNSTLPSWPSSSCTSDSVLIHSCRKFWWVHRQSDHCLRVAEQWYGVLQQLLEKNGVSVEGNVRTWWNWTFHIQTLPSTNQSYLLVVPPKWWHRWTSGQPRCFA